MYQRRCFGCGKENSADIYIKKSDYSTAYYFDITKLLL